MPLLGLLLRTLSFHTLGLDELGGIVDREAADLLTLGTKERCACASVAGVTTGVEGAHPVLVSTRVLRPVLARQKHQAFVPVTLTRCDSLGVRDFDSLGNVPHSRIILCSPLRYPCSPFG